MMSSPLITVPSLALLFAGMLWSISILAKRFQWHCEVSRKAAHVGMGLVTLSFPWIFDSITPVLVLGIVLIGGLVLVRCSQRLRCQVGGALHGIERKSFGEIYFAAAVVIVFWLAKGDPILFCVPILVLTVADAAGALVGRRYGEMKFDTLSGRKSTEGCITVFLVTFFAAHIPLLLFSEISRSGAMIIALSLAILVMLFEAIAFDGLDNLFIPLGGWFALNRFMDLDDQAMLARFVVLVVLLFFVIGAKKRSSLDGSGILGCVLLGYACLSLGGFLFFLPLLLFFVSHLIETPRIRRSGKADTLRHDLRAVFAIAATSMFWVVLKTGIGIQALLPFTIALGIHFAISNYGTLTMVRPEWNRRTRIAAATVKASFIIFLPLAVLDWPGTLSLLVGVGALFLGALIFSIRYSDDVPDTTRRWIEQTVLVLILSSTGLLIRG